MDVTATLPDGKEIFRDSKVYMPVPGRMGRGDKMGRGPYEKSGIIRDTALPPLRTVTEKYDIQFPFKDVKENGKTVRKILAHEMTINVELWYMPYGSRIDEENNALFRKFTKKVSIEKD